MSSPLSPAEDPAVAADTPALPGEQLPGGPPAGLDDALAAALAALEALDQPAKPAPAPVEQPVVRGIPARSSVELVAELKAELETARGQLDSARKAMAGLQREVQVAREDLTVARKRIQRAEQEGPFQGTRKTLETLLGLFDNLYAVAGHLMHNEALTMQGRQAVEMLTGETARCLQRLDVEPFDAVGQPFDPNDHELISHFRDLNQPNGVVLRQAGRGYRLQGRLLRGARVIVNRKD